MDVTLSLRQSGEASLFPAVVRAPLQPSTGAPAPVSDLDEEYEAPAFPDSCHITGAGTEPESGVEELPSRMRSWAGKDLHTALSGDRVKSEPDRLPALALCSFRFDEFGTEPFLSALTSRPVEPGAASDGSTEMTARHLRGHRTKRTLPET